MALLLKYGYFLQARRGLRRMHSPQFAIFVGIYAPINHRPLQSVQSRPFTTTVFPRCNRSAYEGRSTNHHKPWQMTWFARQIWIVALRSQNRYHKRWVTCLLTRQRWCCASKHFRLVLSVPCVIFRRFACSSSSYKGYGKDRIRMCSSAKLLDMMSHGFGTGAYVPRQEQRASRWPIW